MISTEDLERLIAVKKYELANEKTALGLSSLGNQKKDKENEPIDACTRKVKTTVLSDQIEQIPAILKTHNVEEVHESKEEIISPELERYIRRYIGLPVMLKAGEYSPNNPLIRSERPAGDALLGLGEYERRRNTLRKLRQQQYKEYLDQQAKKKQEEKEKAERERREREEKEREVEERERERERERQERARSPVIRRASYTLSHDVDRNHSNSYYNKVDTAIQVEVVNRPLSVAVQTEDTEISRLAPSASELKLTEAERELSPRTVIDKPCAETWRERRRSYGDFDDRSSLLLRRSDKSCDKLTSEPRLRHSYMPSIFDADAIQMRNMQAEKEAAERRLYYQRELKNQIMEQQRIREERKAREMLLEQAEMRRLEQQLRMLRVAQEREVGRQADITTVAKEHLSEYDKQRKLLQNQIDLEQQNFLRATSLPVRLSKRNTHTSQSDSNANPSKIPLYYPTIRETPNENTEIVQRKPFSTNIPENSIFAPNYDVESYLRRNLNPTRDSLRLKFSSDSNIQKNQTNYEDNKIFKPEDKETRQLESKKDLYSCADKEPERNMVVEHALVHQKPKEKLPDVMKRGEMFMKQKSVDESLSIPVLKHSPKTKISGDNTIGANLSDAMKLVDDKWKVPAVQKNILKSLPKGDGKNISILTQLGSIRRQLQLEQLKLDEMLSKDNV